MTALFSSGWAGTVYIEDMNRGVMDRLLASPVRRGAMMIGTLAYQAADHDHADLIVLVVAVLAGARFPGGAVGSWSRWSRPCLISVIIASLSNALALLLRQQEALIGISQFIVLPLQFLSSAIMATALAAAWMARRALQPGRLGGGRLARGAVGRHRLGARCGPGSACSPRSRWSWPGSRRVRSGTYQRSL